jgi:hypothetical protein
MDEHKPASGEEHSQPEGPFRRAYAWPILWGPWVTSITGLVLLVFGMTVNSPVPVRVTALGLGPLTVVAGLLLPRMQGALELSATGFKGQISGIPAALMIARRAAENAIPEDVPNRDELAEEAAQRAVLDTAFGSQYQLPGLAVRRTTFRMPWDNDMQLKVRAMNRARHSEHSDEPPPAKSS